MDHANVRTLYNGLVDVPPYNSTDLLEDHQWQALQEFGQLDVRHIKVIACLAEMFNCICRTRHNDNAVMGWSWLEKSFPDLVKI